MSLVNKLAVIEKLNHQLVQLVDIPPHVIVRKIPARELIFKKNRFDILLKYAYVEAYIQQYDSHFFRELFNNQVKCITGGSYKEKDGRKKCLNDYIKSFQSLINSISSNGFDENISYIPINSKGECIDGAHRLAAAAYFDLEVVTAELDYSHTLDSIFFHNKGLDQTFCDYAALLFCKLNPNAYIVNLHAVSEGQDKEVEKILSFFGEVYYKKTVFLTESGYHWLSRISYKNEPWIGRYQNSFLGAKQHSEKCYKKDLPIRVYVINCTTHEKIRKAKKYIRKIYNNGNYSVHITDTREETNDLAQIFLNGNCIHFLNNTLLFKTIYHENVFKQLSEFKLWLHRNNIDYSNICIDGSYPMTVYGLRLSRDIDYLINSKTKKLPIESNQYDNHSSELKFHSLSSGEILYNPNNHFYFEGIKMISLPVLLEFKSNRMEIPKDLKDIDLIHKIFDAKFRIRRIHKELKLQIKAQYYMLIALFLNFVFKIFPKNTRRRKILHTTNKILLNWRLYFHRIVDSEENKINYCNYKLYYSKKTSIVERLFISGEYERNLQEAIASNLTQKNGFKQMLDIGANIGMISLGALSKFSDLKIFAFEPGPHQNNLFKKTIKKNDLQNKIILYQKALYNKIGTEVFKIHSSEHSSGDGFFDTGRAGITKTITVQTDTLDNWWENQGRPLIDLVKIDTEGAELLVLQGASRFLAEVKPCIIFEVHTENLNSYSYNASDLFKFLKNNNYNIKNLNMTALGQNQIDRLNGHTPYGCELMALPRNS